jgi:Putative Actinobacterial Holin-X, holin superfamily III
METDLENRPDATLNSEASVTSLVAGIVHDAHELLEQQLDLLKHEMRADIAKVKVGMNVLAIGCGIGLLGGMLVGLAMVALLQEQAPHLALWECYGICGGVVLAMGAALYAAGWAMLNNLHPVSEQTTQALKENLQWKTKPT